MPRIKEFHVEKILNDDLQNYEISSQEGEEDAEKKVKRIKKKSPEKKIVYRIQISNELMDFLMERRYHLFKTEKKMYSVSQVLDKIVLKKS